MSNLLNTNYQVLFPENLKKYKNLKALAVQFEKNFKKDIISQLPKLAIYRNIEQQSDEVLSELAYQYTIDNWKETLSREVKINLIKNAYWAHAKKGTKIAIIENLKKLNYPLEVQEWYEHDGKPFTFKIITGYRSTPEWIDSLVYIIDKYKNCRSILETIALETSREVAKYKIGHYRVGEITKEFIGTHYDQNRKAKIKYGAYRLLEMEVERKCMKA
ncbi:phage tail protein I [uncultured Fusobacterium sp.]|uniref:phage tail protein I n=1 Tax=uncultured Fusobacterium sp. TaxID=159267 RepID=UPI0025EEE3FB|nr:phage tail protein I [uncultured Fusobacterium sp.]